MQYCFLPLFIENCPKPLSPTGCQGAYTDRVQLLRRCQGQLVQEPDFPRMLVADEAIGTQRAQLVPGNGRIALWRDKGDEPLTISLIFTFSRPLGPARP